MTMPRVRLGDLLVEAQILSRAQLDEMLALQARDGRRLGTLLVEAGLVTETQVTQIIGQQLAVPWASLHHVEFTSSLLGRVPAELCHRHCLVPILVRRVRGLGDALYVAMDDPGDDRALAAVEAAVGMPVRPMIAPPSEIRAALRVYYGGDAADRPGSLAEAIALEEARVAAARRSVAPRAEAAEAESGSGPTTMLGERDGPAAPAEGAVAAAAGPPAPSDPAPAQGAEAPAAPPEEGRGRVAPPPKPRARAEAPVGASGDAPVGPRDAPPGSPAAGTGGDGSAPPAAAAVPPPGPPGLDAPPAAVPAAGERSPDSPLPGPPAAPAPAPPEVEVRPAAPEPGSASPGARSADSSPFDAAAAVRPALGHRPRPPAAARGMVLTLLDGTRVTLPAKGEVSEEDAVASSRGATRAAQLIRALARGEDPGNLGQHVRWESVASALITVLLDRKIITEAELLAELERH